MKRFTLAFLSVLFSAGCMSRSFDYKYISLKDIENIKVQSYGRSKLSRLKSDEEMPIRYELARENYVLIFELDREHHWPSLLVAVKSLADDSLVVDPIEIGACGSFDNWGIDYKVDNMEALRYVWSPAFNQGCPVTGNENHPDQQVIAFKVKNKSGEVVGEERLPFALIRNGIYYETDAL